MRTLGDVVWHTPPPPLAILCDGTATATNSDADKVTEDGSTEEGGGRGLCVSSVSVCGEGGEWAWGDDAVSMARLPTLTLAPTLILTLTLALSRAL
mgnify:CR=1 FL=1